jgi:demethylmenaquinone methyltransferase / 2-methoxy-6-polyprenyl-1,4-benzoquinol methylase
MTDVRPARDPARIEAMFDRIVPHYDLMNRLMTVGLDRRWRAAAAAAAAPLPGRPILDACCGTGDLSLALARRYPGAPVTGLDFSQAMLDRARPKAAHAAAAVEFVHGDVLALPFADASFGAVTVGWGVRNVADLARAFAEMLRVAAPGARVVCLEATTPTGAAGRRFHGVWFERVVPAMGALVTGDAEAYAYLPASVRSFPDADGLAAVMRDAGLRQVRYRLFGFGAMALHVGEAPS